MAASRVALVAIVSLACAAGAVFSFRADLAGESSARRAAEIAVIGEVVQITRTGGRADLGAEIVVRYTIGKAVRSGSMQVGAQLAALRPGEAIELLADPRDPTAVRPAAEATAPAVSSRSAALVALGAVVGGVATWFGVSLARRRRVLVRNPWVVVPAQIVDVPAGHPGGRSRYLLLDDPTSELVTAEAAGVRPIVDEMSPAVWVAGSGERFLVAAPGGAPVLPVRRVRTPGLAT